MITSWLISRLEYDTQQQNGVHDESFFSRREKLTVVYKMAPRKPNHRVYPRIASRQRAIFKKNSRHVLRKVLLYLLVQAMLLLSPRRDFWLIVSQSCACHSPRTVFDTTSISALLAVYKITFEQCKVVWQINGHFDWTLVNFGRTYYLHQ